MTVTRTQAIANTREMMDAVLSTRWDDTFISTVLGIVSAREWSGILGTNPYYRFAQRTVTTASDGTFAWTALDSGSGDTAQTHYRLLAMTDGNMCVYRETSFMAMPLASTSNYLTPYAKFYYDAGDNVQVLPVQGGISLTVAVNWTPPRVDLLSAGSINIDFPDGHEVILWLEAAAMLLMKGGMENDASQTMRAMADQERQQMYSDLRRSARPQFMQFNDSAAEWGGRW